MLSRLRTRVFPRGEGIENYDASGPCLSEEGRNEQRSERAAALLGGHGAVGESERPPSEDASKAGLGRWVF